MKNERKWSPNGSQNPLKINKKWDWKIDAKTDAKKDVARTKNPGARGPKATYYQQDFLRKNNKKENYLHETYPKTN